MWNLGSCVFSLFFFAVISSAVGEYMVSSKPCKVDDIPCLNNLAKLNIDLVLAGIPVLDIKPSDPMYIDFLNADLAGLKYNLSKVIVNGFKNCDVKNTQVDLKINKLEYELICVLEFRGEYITKGRLFHLPVEGDGTFFIKTGKISLPVNSELAKIQGKDGKEHFNIKKFTLEPVPLEPVHFDFKNLFNGNKELSDGIHKFANENSEKVTREVSGPLYTATVEVLTKGVNQFLKAVPAEDFVIA